MRRPLQQPRDSSRWAMFQNERSCSGRPATAARRGACGDRMEAEVPQQRRKSLRGASDNRQRQQHSRQPPQVPQPKAHFSEKTYHPTDSAKQQPKHSLPPVFSNRNNASSKTPNGQYTTPQTTSKMTYAQAASTRKPKPSRIFDNIHPKGTGLKQNWVEHGQPLPDSFLSQSLSRQRLWQQGMIQSSVVNWILRTRRNRWERMATCKLQNRLLDSPECLTVPGIIYALVFPKTKELYIGQSVNSAWHRWKQHVQVRWRDTLERSLHRMLQKVHVAADALVIPLEVIPMSGHQKEGRHTDQFIAEFKWRAFIREQEWIKW